MTGSTITAIICGPRVYEFKGTVFELHSYMGPWPLKKDGSPKKLAGRTFYDLVKRWESEPDKEKYRIADGGCRLIHA